VALHYARRESKLGSVAIAARIIITGDNWPAARLIRFDPEEKPLYPLE